MSGPRANWGRWGDDDELGCLNLIDAAATQRGLAAARAGRSYALGHVIGSAASPVASGKRAAVLHHMQRLAADHGRDDAADSFVHLEDFIGLPVHAATTHIDALGHGGAEGRGYNGVPLAETTARGVRRNSVEAIPPIVTRAHVVDAPRLTGVRVLADDTVVEAADLEQWLGGSDVRPGDAVLLRTGWPGTPGRPNDVPLQHPGVGESTVEWFADHGVALLGSDTLGVEAYLPGAPIRSPLHVRFLRDLGLPLVELLHLDELARDEVTEGCLVVAPLRIRGGTGSPVNPVLIV